MLGCLEALIFYHKFCPLKAKNDFLFPFSFGVISDLACNHG